MFKDVKIGDRVWDVQYGWGVVEAVGSNDFDVIFEERDLDGDLVEEDYRFDGRTHSWVRNPTLFWDEIKFAVPEKPARLVDRTFEGWVNLYTYQQPYFHENKERATATASAAVVGPFAVTVTLHGVPEGTDLKAVQGLGDINELP